VIRRRTGFQSEVARQLPEDLSRLGVDARHPPVEAKITELSRLRRIDLGAEGDKAGLTWYRHAISPDFNHSDEEALRP
jgi:hypothetical protein